MVCILQLSDLHLMSDPAAELRGSVTRDIVQRVLNRLRRGIAAGEWSFDRIVLTGDLAHDEQRTTYEYLRELLGDWAPRCLLLPGNHDERSYLREVFPEIPFADGPFIAFSQAVEGWQLIGVDSHVPGEVPGRLGAEQLQWLRDELAAQRERRTVLFLHHPPFPIASAWLDQIGLQNADDLWAALADAPQVKAICAGHVHQDFETEADGRRLLTTPSASLQFKPRTDGMELDDAPPGFRILYLDGDELRSEVVRVAE